MKIINRQALSLIAFSVASSLGCSAFAMTLERAATICEDSGFRIEAANVELADSSTPSPQTSRTEPVSNDKWRMFEPNSLKNSYDLWIDGEVLLWQSNVGSLDYGTTSKSETHISDGRVKHPDFNWDWGVRLGLGYKLPHDKWDLFLNYTYVQASAHGHARGSDKVVFPTWASNFSGQNPFFANAAKAHWNMNLNMGDIELGRTCRVSQWLTIRPFMGVRGLVIDQDYHVAYKGGTVAPSGEDKIHMDTDFWGVGIRMGGNSLWGLGLGFSLYGNGSASLLSGNFDVHEREKNSDTSVLNVERDIENVVVAADLAIGLQWDYMFSKDRCHFGMKFGWEFDMFFDQSQLFNFIGNGPGSLHIRNDDLTFQGLTMGVRFDF